MIGVIISKLIAFYFSNSFTIFSYWTDYVDYMKPTGFCLLTNDRTQYALVVAPVEWKNTITFKIPETTEITFRSKNNSQIQRRPKSRI